MFIDCFLGYINYSEFGFIRLSERLATRLVQKTCRLKVCTQSFCYVVMHLALYVAYAKHCQFQPGPDHSGVIDPSRAICKYLWEIFEFPLALMADIVCNKDREDGQFRKVIVLVDAATPFHRMDDFLTLTSGLFRICKDDCGLNWATCVAPRWDMTPCCNSYLKNGLAQIRRHVTGQSCGKGLESSYFLPASRNTVCLAVFWAQQVEGAPNHRWSSKRRTSYCWWKKSWDFAPQLPNKKWLDPKLLHFNKKRMPGNSAFVTFFRKLGWRDPLNQKLVVS